MKLLVLVMKSAIILTFSICLFGCDDLSSSLDQRKFGLQISSSKDDGSKDVTINIPEELGGLAGQIQIQEGSSVANEMNASDLNIPEGTAPAGPSVSVSNSDNTDVNFAGRLEISLPFDSKTSLTAQNLAVFYSVYNSEGRVVIGVLTHRSFRVVDDYMVFNLVGFGNYQAARVPIEIKEDIQVETKDSQIMTKDEVLSLPAIQLASVKPLVVHKGDSITIKGANFRPGIRGVYLGQRISQIEIINDSTLNIVVNSASRRGVGNLFLTQDGVELALQLGYLGEQGGYPLITLADTQVCKGQVFYNSAGEQRTGKKDCDGPSFSTCNQDGQTNCIANSNFRAVNMNNVTAGNIRSGVSIAGIAGNMIESPGACSANGSQSCVANGSFFAAQVCAADASQCYIPNYVESTQPLKAINYDEINPNLMLGSLSIGSKVGTIVERGVWDLSEAFPGDGYYVGIINTPATNNIKRGISIAGVTGDFPSASSPLPRFVDDGATTDTTGSDLPDLTAFITQLTTDGTFEFWDSKGRRYTGSGDSNLTAANIKEGVNIANLAITGTLPSSPILTPSNFYGNFASDPDRVELSWEDMGVAGYILIAREGDAVDWTPTHGQVYGTGFQGANELIYVGASSSFIHEGISSGESFHYALYAHNANYYYSATPSTTSVEINSNDCSGLVSGIWVKIPGDPDFGTSDFCVMKYHAKNVGGVASSQAASAPWVDISQSDSIENCTGLGSGYHLITIDEWMTIASNIASVGDNWSGGIVGSGSLNRGHSDNSPSNALAASSDDNDACSGTGQNCNASTWDMQRRTFKLTNGEVIWDFSGNVWTWTSYFQPTGKATPATSNWTQYPSVGDGANTTLDMLVPTNAVKSWWDDSWDSAQGIGQYTAGANGSGGALRRGGSWSSETFAGVFTASLEDGPSSTFSTAGFRCTSPLP